MLSCSAELKDLEAVIRLGVRGILMKPFLASDVEAAIEEHLAINDRRPADNAPKEVPLTEHHSFVRSSKRMRELEQQASLVARADIPVLILGESGTFHAQDVFTQPAHLPQGQLRSCSGRPSGERTLRLRARCLHWSR